MLYDKMVAVAPPRGQQRSEIKLRVALPALLAFAIAIDLLVPVNVNIAVLYAVIVACAAFSNSAHFLLAITGAAALASFAGYLGAGPLGSPAPEVVLLNRAIGFITILGVGALARAIQAARERLKQLSASADEERALLSALVEHLPVGVIVVDRDGNPLFCNPAYTAIVPDAVLPSQLPDATERWIGYHDDGRRIARDHFAGVRALRGDFVSGTEFLHRSEAGIETWTRVSAVPIRNTSGEITGALCVVVDIDEHKRAEQALQELTSVLEQRVEERTAELIKAQDSLRQVQKLESIGQLTGGVAHDFNNLLTPIMGALDMLQRNGVGSDRERRLVDGAMTSAERARTLVQRLLAFARRQPLQPGPVDLDSLISGMTDLIRTTLGPKIKLELAIQPDLPPAQGDRHQLELALLNLVVNARDAMPEGGRLAISGSLNTVTGSSRSNLPRGSYLSLTVSDTGIGMDESILARAIEPFFSTKGIGKGSGLGLSMVHGLAAQLGGELFVSSSPGAGTKVELWLPVSADAPLQTPSGARPQMVASSGMVLFVEDEDLLRQSGSEILSDLGFAVTQAPSAEDALRLLDEGSNFDFVVTDHLMPGMTGTELARAIVKRGLSLPVLIVTGYADIDSLAPDLPRLGKPFRAADLAAAIQELRKP